MPPNFKFSKPNIQIARLRSNTGGIVQNRSEIFLSPNEAVDIINMHAVSEGSWSADNAGYSIVNANGTAFESGNSIDGLVWFTDSSLVDHLFFACNQKLKEVTISTGVATDIDAAAGYTKGAQVQFQALNNVLFSCDGNIATPRKWDGSTAAASGGWPISDGTNSYTKPKFIGEHQGRLVYANFSGFPSHLILSNQYQGETFTLPATTGTHAYVAKCGVGDGQYIVGHRTIPIPYSNKSQFVIFKNRSVYTLVGSSALLTDPDPFTIVKINGNYGAFNNNCIVQVGPDLFALNEFGIISYTSSAQNGTLQPLAINSDLVRNILSRLNLAQTAKFWGLHMPDRREIWWGVATGSSTTVNEYIVYKYPSPADANTTPKFSRRTDAGSQFLMAQGARFQQNYYCGDYSGHICQLFNSSQYGATGIPWRYEYPYYDYGNDRQIKRFLDGSIHLKVRSNQTINMETIWRFGGNNNYFFQAIPVTTTVSGSLYNQAYYNQAYYGAVQELKKQFRAPGNGGKVKYTLSGVTNTTGPEFLGLTTIVEPGALTQHWN